jgi:hypothetical protein
MTWTAKVPGKYKHLIQIQVFRVFLYDSFFFLYVCLFCLYKPSTFCLLIFNFFLLKFRYQILNLFFNSFYSIVEICLKLWKMKCMSFQQKLTILKLFPYHKTGEKSEKECLRRWQIVFWIHTAKYMNYLYLLILYSSPLFVNIWSPSYYCLTDNDSTIVAISFTCGGNRSTWRKPSTCRKSLTNFIT